VNHPPLRSPPTHGTAVIQTLVEAIRALSAGNRVLLIVTLALVAHGLVLVVRRVGRWILGGKATGPGSLARRRPKAASLTTLVVSALTFLIYFGAVGVILGELGVSLTPYFASATVIGLAVGFGLQGLVQDVVIGLTLIFSDVLDVGDVADVGGQTGRVESIGLRFVSLRTLLDQRVVIPNRNVGQINRYRDGTVLAWLDAQVPPNADEETVAAAVERVARSATAQHAGVLVAPPAPLGVHDAGGWRYVRVRFTLWPGQGGLLETVVRQRVLAAVRALDPEYADWMVAVTYRTRPEAPAGEGLP
jgi:small conductance mechanosensitive channel